LYSGGCSTVAAELLSNVFLIELCSVIEDNVNARAGRVNVGNSSIVEQLLVSWFSSSSYEAYRHEPPHDATIMIKTRNPQNIVTDELDS
jgi:hypothetical protein